MASGQRVELTSCIVWQFEPAIARSRDSAVKAMHRHAQTLGYFRNAQAALGHLSDRFDFEFFWGNAGCSWHLLTDLRWLPNLITRT